MRNYRRSNESEWRNPLNRNDRSECALCRHCHHHKFLLIRYLCLARTSSFSLGPPLAPAVNISTATRSNAARLPPNERYAHTYTNYSRWTRDVERKRRPSLSLICQSAAVAFCTSIAARNVHRDRTAPSLCAASPPPLPPPTVRPPHLRLPCRRRPAVASRRALPITPPNLLRTCHPRWRPSPRPLLSRERSMYRRLPAAATSR